MQKTSKGLIVVRVAVPKDVWDEISNVANEEGITYNRKVKNLLTGWALKQMRERKKTEELEAHFDRVRNAGQM